MYRVMIVDDEMAIRTNLAKAIPFTEHGFQVTDVAANGEEALAMLATARPDLIFLDVCMPIIDGIGFLKELRTSEYKGLQVIMLSGYSEFSYAQKLFAMELRLI